MSWDMNPTSPTGDGPILGQTVGGSNADFLSSPTSIWGAPPPTSSNTWGAPASQSQGMGGGGGPPAITGNGGNQWNSGDSTPKSPWADTAPVSSQGGWGATAPAPASQWGGGSAPGGGSWAATGSSTPAISGSGSMGSQQSQWGTSPPGNGGGGGGGGGGIGSGGNSWAERARKNVGPPMGAVVTAAAPAGPGSGAPGAPPPIRPNGGGGGGMPGGGSHPTGWGQPSAVDQRTPWETGESKGDGHHHSHRTGTSVWKVTTNPDGTPSNLWTGPPPPDNPDLYWKPNEPGQQPQMDQHHHHQPPPQQQQQQHGGYGGGGNGGGNGNGNGGGGNRHRPNMWDNSMAAPPPNPSLMWRDPNAPAQQSTPPPKMWHSSGGDSMGAGGPSAEGNGGGRGPPSWARNASSGGGGGGGHHQGGDRMRGGMSSDGGGIRSGDEKGGIARKSSEPDKGLDAWGDPSIVTVAGPIQRWKASADDAGPAQSSWGSTTPGDAATAQQSGAVGGNGGGGSWNDTPSTPNSWAENGWAATNGEINKRESADAPSTADDVFSSNVTTPITPLFSGGGNSQQSLLPMAAATMLAQSAFQQQQQAKVAPADMAELTNQIADKLRTAIKAGWISADVMSKRLPEPAMFLLNELLLRVPKLEQAKLELQSFQNLSDMNNVQQAECERINSEICRLKTEMQLLQEKIYTQVGKGQNGMSAPGCGSNEEPLSQSKLMSWKMSTSAPLNSGNDDKSPSALDSAFQGLGLGGTTSDMWSNKDKEKSGAEIENGKLDLSGFPSPWKRGEDIPEFKPGQPWLYKGHEIDENTTPSDLRSRKGMSLAEAGVDPEQRLNSAMPMGGPMSQMTPTKFEPKMVYGNADLPGNQTFRPVMNNRPASQMGNARGGPMRPGSAFTPYGGQAGWMPGPPPPPPPPGGQCILLLNVTNPPMDDSTLKITCQRYGIVDAVIMPPGSTFAAVKYKSDQPLDRIAMMLHQELGRFGVSVQLAKEQEAIRLFQAASVPPPPRHRGPPPGPMGPMGMPPPVPGWGPDPSAVTWGAPPFLPPPPFDMMAPGGIPPPPFGPGGDPMGGGGGEHHPF